MTHPKGQGLHAEVRLLVFSVIDGFDFVRQPMNDEAKEHNPKDRLISREYCYEYIPGEIKMIPNSIEHFHG